MSGSNPELASPELLSTHDQGGSSYCIYALTTHILLRQPKRGIEPVADRPCFSSCHDSLVHNGVDSIARQG